MGSLDIDQAARASGLSARDVRELIERGKLPATRPAGRWLIDQRHLAAAAPRPEVDGARPIGATAATPQEDAGTLLARLEEAQSQISDLRVERDELRLRLREQVSSLQRSLEDSMEELDDARARLAELESRRRPRAVPDLPETDEKPRPEPLREPVRPGGIRARDALTPLFRATTDERDVGSPADRD
jgi:excisionase family DNA binding protein